MLTGIDALKKLEADLDKAEDSRSQYWDHSLNQFTVKLDGTVYGETVLGEINRKPDPFRSVAHWLLQWPFRRIGARFKTFKECENLGRLIAGRTGRQFTRDMVRQSLTLALLRDHLDLDDPSGCNLVIGDGLGVMTSLLLLSSPSRKTIAINLTKPLLLDLAHARQAVPEAMIGLAFDADTMDQALDDPNIRLIGVQADNASIISAAAVDLAVNIVSMQEMMPPVVARYFEILRSNKTPRTAFYCCNKLSKQVGSTAVSDFMDYPWQDNDEVLVDEVCSWGQFHYSMRPPFWHRRDPDRTIWHRLARLTGKSSP